MSHFDIELKVVKAKKTDIIPALRELAESDGDFNGNNGEEYLWDGLADQGYDNNLDYVIAHLKETDDYKDKVKQFFEEWLDADGYYHDYHYECTEIGDEVVISLAYMTCV